MNVADRRAMSSPHCVTSLDVDLPPPRLSVVIPLYNCLPLTQAMLASLRTTLPDGITHEIIMVDDGSTDGTREWLGTLRDAKFRVLLNERNLDEQEG